MRPFKLHSICIAVAILTAASGCEKTKSKLEIEHDARVHAENVARGWMLGAIGLSFASLMVGAWLANPVTRNNNPHATKPQ